jgi:peptide/nickel transport system permease protein
MTIATPPAAPSTRERRAIPSLSEGRARLFGRALRRYRKLGIVVPSALLVIVVLLCYLGPTVFGLPSPTSGKLTDSLLPIGSPGHLLGTNSFGNDMLSQLLVGGQNTITISVAATAIGFVIGSLIGMVAGYFEGVVGAVLMRVLDVIFAFPDIILAILIAAYLGPSTTNAIWAIGFFSIAGFGRIARAQTLRVTHLDYVVAARSSGSSRLRILLTHVWPNISGRVVAYALVAVGYAMMAEAALSFLGVGVPSPQPSWGVIIGSNQNFITAAPRLIVMPAICLFIVIASANLLSDAIQEKRAAG